MREDSFYKCILISYQFSSIYLTFADASKPRNIRMSESDKISLKSGFEKIRIPISIKRAMAFWHSDKCHVFTGESHFTKGS